MREMVTEVAPDPLKYCPHAGFMNMGNVKD